MQKPQGGTVQANALTQPVAADRLSLREIGDRDPVMPIGGPQSGNQSHRCVAHLSGGTDDHFTGDA